MRSAASVARTAKTALAWVVDQIRYDYDDRAILATGLAYGAD